MKTAALGALPLSYRPIRTWSDSNRRPPDYKSNVYVRFFGGGAGPSKIGVGRVDPQETQATHKSVKRRRSAFSSQLTKESPPSAGFEPANIYASPVMARRSNERSGPKARYLRRRTRTSDIWLPKPALYQSELFSVTCRIQGSCGPVLRTRPRQAARRREDPPRRPACADPCRLWSRLSRSAPG